MMKSNYSKLQQQPRHRPLQVNISLSLFIAFTLGCLNFGIFYFGISKTLCAYYDQNSNELLMQSKTMFDDNNNNQIERKFDAIPSWLNKIKIGKKIAEGSIASVLEATIVDDDNRMITTNPDGGEQKYIIKITGLRGFNESDRLEKAFNEIDIMNIFRSAPHPSIPQMIYSVKKIPNIFKTNTTTLTLPETLDDDWKEWFLSCKVLSIAVFERAVPTNSLINRDWDFLLPSSEMIYCFLHQLFDALQHAHSHNVMIRDSHIENIIIDHGQVKLFDWNLGLIYDKSKRQLVSQDYRRICDVYINPDDKIHPPEVRIKSHSDMIYFTNVHAYDVYRIGGMVLHIINSTYYVGGEDDGNNNDNVNNEEDNEGGFFGDIISETNNSDFTTSFLPAKEINDLKDMAERMMEYDPNDRPTFQELLDDHIYFKTNNIRFNTTTTKKNKYGKCLLEWRQKATRRNEEKKKTRKKKKERT